MSAHPPPAADKHPPARAPHGREEEATGEETLSHHAKRALLHRVDAAVHAMLDPLIKALQRLLKRTDEATGEGDKADEDEGRGRGQARGAHRSERAEADATDTEAPPPQRRLRTYLIYFSMFLVGALGGGALAYELLSKLLDRQAGSIQRLESAVSKQTKAATSNQKKLEEAEAKKVEAEKKLEEAKKKQAEVEKKLEGILKEVKTVEEKQKKFDEAAKLLDSIRAPNKPPGPAGSADAKPRPLKSGDCTLGSGDAKSLKDCIKEFNR